MKVPEIIEQKVEDFSNNEKSLLDTKFGETETRNRFIDPFFKALGWELEQTHLPRKLWDVHREYSQKDNSSTKKPDYAFRLQGKLKFFVEAKAPWVRIIDNPDKDTMFQAKRYAYSTNGQAPIVIITDFQEFRVFNALQKPLYDNPNQGLLKEFDVKYRDYISKWDLIYENFSKEAVQAGSIERLRGKISKNTKTLDAEFLAQIINWRETLAKNVAIRNEKLTVEEINEAVQRILDRLVFIRNLEDREIISENSLLKTATTKENTYKNLLPLFSELNVNYNGLLFKPHFSEELDIDDKVLKDTIQAMCYPQSPFQFDVIEPEILGRIYEKFLGSKIRLTDSHRAKVEEKEEVRHAGGVYYTPQFIVDYIVKETVGKRVEGLKPEEIEKVKILDPACGSGSFLLGAYAYLMDYHISFYTKHETVKKYKDDFFKTDSGELKLTIKKKGEILINNLWGVDIDREATEVSILSLYLKLLEHGIEDDQGWLFLKGKVLPDMTSNIRHGNSLITRDDLYKNDMFGDSDIKKFDWESETDGFGKIFAANRGFDCIIGNPPYIRIQEMQKWAKTEVDLYKKIFLSGRFSNFDIYVLFLEKVLGLLNESGVTGFILPNKFMQQEYGAAIRKILSEGKHVSKIVNFKDFQVFDNATTYTALLFVTKAENISFKYSEASSEDIVETMFSDQSAEILDENPWLIHGAADAKLFKALSHFQTIGDISDNIFVGVQTSADKIFILDIVTEKKNTYVLRSKALGSDVELEKAFLRHIISGVDVKRYVIPQKRQVVIYPYEMAKDKMHLIDKSDFENRAPKTWSYLVENKKILEDREGGKFHDKEWYRFGRNQNIDKQHLEKLCVPRLVQRIQCIYDSTGSYCQDNVDVGGIILKREYRSLYLYVMGVLNSALLTKYLTKISTPFRGGFWSCNRQYLEKLPIYIPDKNDPIKFSLCEKIPEIVQQIVDLRQAGKTGDAEFLEKKIDEMVEQIYGVS